MSPLRYRVTSEAADDPEAKTTHVWTAVEIGQCWPFLAPLFEDEEGYPSLTYIWDVNRICIEPIYEPEA